jgi:hypothetical protein
MTDSLLRSHQGDQIKENITDEARACMVGNKRADGVLAGKRERKKPLGSQRRRREDNITRQAMYI